MDLTAARSLRAGHPWVFKDALLRGVEGLEPGSVVPLTDEEGYPIGAAMVDGPDAAVPLRMVSDDPAFKWSTAQVEARVEAAIRFREGFVDEGIVGSHRVIHGESDGFPGLAVDRLGEYLLVYKYSRIADGVLDLLLPVLGAMDGIKGVYRQDRHRPVTADERRPPATLVVGSAAPAEYEVEEDGLRFIVDVTAPVSPGLFLDLREGRRLFEALAPDRRVLNLFSFTGAFALRSVRAGAASVVNVDAAARSHARCRQNLAASGLDPEACAAETGDAFKYLERFRQRDRLFDLCVVDPPPFSNVKGAVFSALRDWSELMRAVVGVMAPGGVVLAVCNAARLSDEDFLTALGEGARSGGRDLRLVGEVGLPPDFPVLPAFREGRYLKVKLLRVV